MNQCNGNHDASTKQLLTTLKIYFGLLLEVNSPSLVLYVGWLVFKVQGSYKYVFGHCVGEKSVFQRWIIVIAFKLTFKMQKRWERNALFHKLLHWRRSATMNSVEGITIRIEITQNLFAIAELQHARGASRNLIW